MSRLLPRLAAVAAAAAVVLSIGVGSAAASVTAAPNVTTYYAPQAAPVSILAPNVSATVGTTVHFTVKVTNNGSSSVNTAGMYFSQDLYVGDFTQDDSGCEYQLLTPGQTCQESIAFTPRYIGTTHVTIDLKGSFGDAYGGFFATGLRPRVLPPIVSSAGSLSLAQ